MRVGFYQFSPAFGQVERSLTQIERALDGVEADLIVLPELANSGYLFLERSEVEALAEPVPGPSTAFLHELARKRDVYLAMGLPERHGGALYNSAALVGPQGVVGVYRKAHLFYEEKLFFQPGDLGFPVFEVEGAKVGLLICFRHLFPEAALAHALGGAELIAHPSNLVMPTKAQLSTRVRAMENRAFWALCNRYGTEDRGGKSLTYTGCSEINGLDGQVLAEAPEAGDCVRVVELDPAAARDKRVTRLNDLFDGRRADLYA
mgnify:CR=1 FL=1